MVVQFKAQANFATAQLPQKNDAHFISGQK